MKKVWGIFYFPRESDNDTVERIEISLHLKKLYGNLRQYQVGNTSSRKITEDKQLGPWLALGWVTIQV